MIVPVYHGILDEPQMEDHEIDLDGACALYLEAARIPAREFMGNQSFCCLLGWPLYNSPINDAFQEWKRSEGESIPIFESMIPAFMADHFHLPLAITTSIYNRSCVFSSTTTVSDEYHSQTSAVILRDALQEMMRLLGITEQDVSEYQARVDSYHQGVPTGEETT